MIPNIRGFLDEIQQARYYKQDQRLKIKELAVNSRQSAKKIENI
jgi:hypothetical protein